MGTYYILLGLITLVSWMVSSTLKRKFKYYSKTQLRNGMSGAEIAEKMLADHGIRNVRVVSVKGRLTDHYNPKDRTVNLSEAVYHERNAAAAAVAAHECGHAVQHAQAYSWLQMRSTLVPMVNISSSLSIWVIFAGLMLGFGAGLVVRWLQFLDFSNAYFRGLELRLMEANASLVAIAQPIAKWALMLEHMPKKVKTLFALVVLAVVFVLLFVLVVY